MAGGTVMLAMKVGQKRRRNKKMTMTTSATVAASETCTSWNEARMVVVRWLMGEILTEGGIHFATAGSAARMRSTVSMTFAPGCFVMMTSTAGVIPDQPATCAFSTPSTTLPKASRVMGTPFFEVKMSER